MRDQELGSQLVAAVGDWPQWPNLACMMDTSTTPASAPIAVCSRGVTWLISALFAASRDSVLARRVARVSACNKAIRINANISSACEVTT